MAKYLLDQTLPGLAKECLDYVEDKSTFAYQSQMAKYQLMTRQYQDAINTYQTLMEMDATWLPGYIEAGHANIQLKQNQDALNFYLKAIRIANLTSQEIEDPLLYQRAGSIYIQEQKWEDARVMFLMCSEQFKTSYAYFNLGVAAYNLGLYDEAEKVLGVVNYMDSSNTLTWAYLTLTLLKKENGPMNAAFETMNEALKLGLNDVQLLREIFAACLKVGQYRAARDVQEHLLIVLAGQKWQKRMKGLFPSAAEVIRSHERLEVVTDLYGDLRQLCTQLM